MRRSVLLTLMALGMTISLLGATGIMATFTDSASTADNTFATGTRPSTADVQLATYSNGTHSCGTFGDSVSQLFSITNQQPTTAPVGDAFFCVKNNGAGTLAITVRAIDLLDTELACTGDEAVVDNSCTAGAQGEVSQIASPVFTELTCATGAPGAGNSYGPLTDLASAEGPFIASLAPDAFKCYEVYFLYQPTTTQATLAQTDQASWKFRFTGTA